MSFLRGGSQPAPTGSVNPERIELATAEYASLLSWIVGHAADGYNHRLDMITDVFNRLVSLAYDCLRFFLSKGSQHTLIQDMLYQMYQPTIHGT